MKLIFEDARFGAARKANVAVQVYFYQNRQVCIRLCIAETGEPWATATLNDNGYIPPEGCVVIKDYSENTGLDCLLVKAGILEPAPAGVSAPGFPVFRMTTEFAAVVEIEREKLPRKMRN